MIKLIHILACQDFLLALFCSYIFCSDGYQIIKGSKFEIPHILQSVITFHTVENIILMLRKMQSKSSVFIITFQMNIFVIYYIHLISSGISLMLCIVFDIQVHYFNVQNQENVDFSAILSIFIILIRYNLNLNPPQCFICINVPNQSFCLVSIICVCIF